MAEGLGDHLVRSERRVRPSQAFSYLVSGEIEPEDYARFLAAERKARRRAAAEAVPSRSPGWMTMRVCWLLARILFFEQGRRRRQVAREEREVALRCGITASPSET